MKGVWRDHPGIVVLVVLGALLRVAVILAYRPAFWYRGDSGSYLRLIPLSPRPDEVRPVGYVVLLKALAPTGTTYSIVVVQHLLGLAVAVGIYVYLYQRGVPRWLACCAAAPLVFDGLQVTLEHYVLTETLFTAVLVAGVLLVVDDRIPGPQRCAVAGLLMVFAWFVRPVALALIGVLVSYLVLRRSGWRGVVAFAAAALIPFGVLTLVMNGRPTGYRSSVTAMSLYGRTAVIADCDLLDLSAELRKLCPAEPLDRRPDRPDWYLWVGGPGRGYPRGDPRLTEFALEVIRQQPGDYLRRVARDAAPFFMPVSTRAWGIHSNCLVDMWIMPVSVRDMSYCHGELAQSRLEILPAERPDAPPATALTRALHTYSRYVRLPAPVTTAVILLAVVAVAAAVRRRGAERGAAARDAVTLLAVTIVLLVGPVAMLMYEPRYGLPALPFVCAAGALAIHSLMTASPRAGPDG